VRGLVGPKVKKIRYVAEEQWFPEEREPNVDHRFFTVWQESFYYAYIDLGV